MLVGGRTDADRGSRRAASSRNAERGGILRRCKAHYDEAQILEIIQLLRLLSRRCRISPTRWHCRWSRRRRGFPRISRVRLVLGEPIHDTGDGPAAIHPNTGTTITPRPRAADRAGARCRPACSRSVTISAVIFDDVEDLQRLAGERVAADGLRVLRHHLVDRARPSGPAACDGADRRR